MHRKKWMELSEEEALERLTSLKKRIESKRERDLAYLKRREKRSGGMDTPTDVLLKQDQELMGELLDFISEAIEVASEA